MKTKLLFIISIVLIISYSNAQVFVEEEFSMKPPVKSCLNYIWDFGDGNTITTEDTIVTHIYELPGQYSIMLLSEYFCEDENIYKTDTVLNIITAQINFNNYITYGPNPYSAHCDISYTLPFSCNMHLFITDPNGSLVIDLVNGYQPSGTYSYAFRAQSLGYPPGSYKLACEVDGQLYFYHLQEMP